MSRVGKRPIKVPAGVKVSFTAPNVEVNGKGGKLHKKLPPNIKVEVKGDEVHVVNTSSDPEKRSLHGLSRTLISNMMVGVTDGYSRGLELQGVGYRAQAAGTKLTMQLGFSHPVE